MEEREQPHSPPLLTRLVESIGIELILISAGDFRMGTSREQLDKLIDGKRSQRGWMVHETPPHPVEISQAFYIGKYPVTQQQWKAVMGANPSHFKGDDLPVETVSWDDVQEFMRQLNAIASDEFFRLPAEAEWEYACRAGSIGLYCFGDEVYQLGDYGWYSNNSARKTHPVGQKKPNAWGVYDMHGNVWEWVQDRYAPTYDERIPNRDPQGPDAGAYRVIRGGSWSHSAQYARSALRIGNEPGDRDDDLGFRCASSVPSK